tara:strand:- start:416 stop:2701 length:2286 start_codon:yes stop_codon:yes gene_type:complete
MGALQSSGEGYQDKIRFYSDNLDTRTDAVFRDPSGWFNVVWVWDSVASTAQASRARTYINGSLASTTGTKSVADDQATDFMNTGQTTDLFKQTGASLYYSGYAAEIIFLDSTASTDCSQFGELDDNNVWVPVNPSGLTYGNNGFLLQFKQNGSGQDANGIGADTSGRNNHFAVGGGAIQSNQVTDTPSDSADNNIGNHTKFNPLDKNSNMTLTNGSLTVTNTGAAAFHGAIANQRIPNSGKYYFEVTLPGTLSNQYIGVVNEANKWDFITAANGSTSAGFYGFYPVNSSSSKLDNGSSSSYGGSIANSSVLGFAIDKDNDEMYVSDDGAYLASSNPVTRASPMLSSLPDNLYVAMTAHNSGGHSVTFNFGQTAFAGSIPSGFKTLSSPNFPVTVTDPSSYFETVTFSGTGGAQNIDTLGFRPDLLIIKSITSSANFNWIDSVRGENELLWSNSNAGESDESSSVTGFRDAGFAVGADSGSYVNISGQTMVTYGFKAGGAPTADNSASAGATPTAGSFKIDDANRSDAHPGTIKTIRGTANTTAGFAILKYNGGDSDTTLGTGLTIPTGTNALAIIKKTSANNDWHVSYEVDGTIGAAELNNPTGSTTAEVDNFHSDSGTTITIDASSGLVNDDADYICYLWKEIAGYSKFGRYTGNGASAPNGTYVNVGFRPKWLMIHRTDGADEWVIFDSVRNPHNECEKYLSAHYADGERTNAAAKVDLFSNGFRPTVNHARVNSGTYFYAAFAEFPSGGDTIAQAKAR